MLTDLKTFFETPPVRKLIPSTNMRKIVSCLEHTIYSLNDMGTFLNILKSEGKKAVRVRFLVDNGGQLWFARETSDDSEEERKNPSPPHFRMTGEARKNAKCLTAGTCYFNLEQNLLMSGDHKSGDFNPDFPSLKWLFLILMRAQKLPFKLPELFEINELHESNGGPMGTHKIPMSIIRDWTDGVAAETPISEQTHETKSVCYDRDGNPVTPGTEDTRKKARFSLGDDYAGLRLTFDSSDDEEPLLLPKATIRPPLLQLSSSALRATETTYNAGFFPPPAVTVCRQLFGGRDSKALLPLEDDENSPLASPRTP